MLPYQDFLPWILIVCLVSVSAGWVATKHNILGEPIQWGLPIFSAAQQSEQGVCRVFKMTVLTGIGAGIAKRATVHRPLDG